MCDIRRVMCLGAARVLVVALAIAAWFSPLAASERVYLDPEGVVRWRADDSEVRLFGANYALPSASDYRAAGYVGADRRALVERDMAHFARMGWDGLRLALWGDWENSDRDGNLIANDHLDLMDWLIHQARRRDIAMLFTPIHTHSSLWPDGVDGDHIQGFSKHFPRDQIGRDPAAIAAQANYLRQILEHVNPYTGLALKDDPDILFIELINEPWHHADDPEGSIAYINALVEAVRSTGCEKILVHNLSQDFRMAPAIRASRAQGVSFGWYPTGLVARRTLSDNFLRWVDDYPPMDDPVIAGMPRLVYEFDAADTLSPAMYPAMVRTFTGAGAQFAAMFAYDMLDTAPYNLGWQTHFLNLVYSPRKAVGAIIAAEAMRRLPRGERFGSYPENTRFGPFGVSPDEGGLAWMDTGDVFMHAGDHSAGPSAPAELQRIVGQGSSTVVQYEGSGSYFLDRIDAGLWRLELYPDAVLVKDPFAQAQNRDAVASRLLWRTWPMAVRLPCLGDAFEVEPLNSGNGHRARATDGAFEARPGVYLLRRAGGSPPGALPDVVGRVGLREFVCPTAPDLAEQVVPRVDRRLAHDPAGVPWSVEIVAETPPDRVMLRYRPGEGGTWREAAMARRAGMMYRAVVDVPPGEVEWGVEIVRDSDARVYPKSGDEPWTVRVVAPEEPLVVFAPVDDFSLLFYSRRDRPREGWPFTLLPAGPDGPARLRVAGAWPAARLGWSVRERIGVRGVQIDGALELCLRVARVDLPVALTVVLIERDGTSWSAPVLLVPGQEVARVTLDALVLGGGMKLPVGYPGSWNVHLPSASDRGGAGDRVRLAAVEQMQLVFPDDPSGTVVELLGVELLFR